MFAASGFFTTKRSNGVDLMHMDWSLIRMEKDRMGNNMVSQITCTLFYVPLTCIRNDADGAPMPPLRTDILNPARALEEDLIVFKLGRSTGWTWGTLSGLRSASITTADEHGKENKIVTMENVVTGRKHGAPFSERGDSGSFVFDANLAVVGMVFAGDSNYGNAYIIPCAELFEDIKRQTGAQDVRISLI